MRLFFKLVFLFFISISIFNSYGATFYSRVSGGEWGSADSWSQVGCGGEVSPTVPGEFDDVIICAGYNVLVKANESCRSITIYGSLLWSSKKILTIGAEGLTINGGTITSSSQIGTLNVGGNFVATGGTNNIGSVDLTISGITTVNSGATLNISETGGVKVFSTLIIYGTFNNAVNQDITINGSLRNDGTYSVGTGRVTFGGASNNTVTGTSAIAFNTITINKGVSKDNVLDAQSLITLTDGGLTLTNGTLKLSNTSISLTPFLSDVIAAPFRIPETAGLWCNGATINSGNFNWTVAGLLRISAGTVNLGTSSDNSFRAVNGTTQLIVEGGTFNVAGAITRVAITDNIVFSMSGGTVLVSAFGVTTVGVSPLQIDQAGSNFSMTSGTIVIRGAGAANLGVTLTAGTISLSAGTIQIGDASSPAAQIININTASTVPNLTINSSTVTARLVSNLTVLQNLTISTGTLDANNFNLFVGNSWTNNGSFLSGSGTLTFNGTGIQSVSNPSGEVFSNFTINKTSGYIALSGNLNVTSVFTMTQGNIDCGSSALTLGTDVVSTGSLVYSSGNIIGTFTRWINSTGSEILFPIGTSTSSRSVSVNFSNLTNGSLTIKFFDTDPGSLGLPLIDAGINIANQFTDGYWEFSPTGLSSTNYNLSLTGNGFSSYTISDATRILYRTGSSGSWALNGTHAIAVGSIANRTSLSGISGQFAFGNPTCSSYSADAISGNSSVCISTTENYYVTNTLGNIYTWVVSGGVIASGQGTSSITVNWGAIGMIGSVQVTEKNSCGTDNTPVVLSVNLNPIATSSISGDALVVVNQVGVVYSVTNTTGYSYTWSFPSGGGSVTTGQGTNTVTVTWGATSGTYPIRVDATRLCGSSDFQTLSVSVSPIIISLASGNWNNAAIWLGGVVPSAGSFVEISAGHTVTINLTASCYQFAIKGNAEWSTNPSKTLNVGNGGIIIYSTGNVTGANAGVLTTTGGITGSSNPNISSTLVDIQVVTVAGQSITATGSFNTLTINANATNTGTIKIAGGGTLAGSATLTQGENSTLTLEGANFTLTNLNAAANGNTVVYGANAAQAVRTGTYHNLTVSTTGSANTKTFAGAIVVNGNINISGVTLDVSASNYAIDVKGNWTNTGTFTPRGGSVTFSGNSDQAITNTTGEVFNNLNMSGSGAKNLTNPITINFDFYLSSTLNAGANNVSIRGNWNNTGYYYCDNNTVTFTNATTLMGTAVNVFQNVVISGSLTGHSNNFYVTGNWTNNGVFNHNGGIVIFNGNAAQAISGTANTTFYSLTVNNSSGVSLSNPITVENNFLIEGGAFSNSSNNVTISGDLTNNASINSGSGTFTFNGTSKYLRGTSPINLTNVVVNGTYIFDCDEPSTFGALTVNATKSLNIAKDRGLSVSSSLSNAGSMLVDAGPNGHSGSLITTNTMTNTGACTFKTSIAKNMWHGLTSPVSNDDVQTVFSDIGSHNNNCYIYNEASTGTDYWVQTTTGALTPGKGFYVYYFSNKYKTYTATSGEVYNSGNYIIPVTYSDPGRKGWNFIGNPFPSAIDWDDEANVILNNVNSAMYIKNGSAWESYTRGLGESGDGFIYPGQGFFVVATANGSVTINNASRVHATTGNLKNLKSKKAAKSTTQPVIRLDLSNDSTLNKTFFRFMSEATSAFDGSYDAYKIFSEDENYNEIYSLSSTNDTLSINTLPVLSSSTIIPVGIKIRKPGVYFINASRIMHFPDSLDVFLHDTQLQLMINLKTDSSYTFYSDVVNTNSRFRLVFSASSTNIAEEISDKFSITQPYFNGDEIWILINYCNCNAINVELFDITGKLIFTNKYPIGSASDLISIKYHNIQSGYYLIKLDNSKETIVRKLLYISK